LVERLHRKQNVAGSNPAGGSKRYTFPMPYKPERRESGDDLQEPEQMSQDAALNERFELQRDLEYYKREIARAEKFARTPGVSEEEKGIALKRAGSMKQKLVQVEENIEYLEEDLPDKKKLN
jgi:hypothetical protein